jgi:hypothetical protein
LLGPVTARFRILGKKRGGTSVVFIELPYSSGRRPLGWGLVLKRWDPPPRLTEDSARYVRFKSTVAALGSAPFSSNRMGKNRRELQMWS